MQTSTVLTALGGGALIGVSASLILLAYGGVAGISNIVATVIRPVGGLSSWRLGFLVGLLATGVFAAIAYPSAIGHVKVSLPLIAIGGVLVGIGTRVGNGCTSGHGVCGISRFSPRSIAATVTFMAVAIVTFALVRLLGGWS